MAVITEGIVAFVFIYFVTLSIVQGGELEDEVNSVAQYTGQTYRVDGKITVIDDKLRSDWIAETKILINGGEIIGFARSDGTFTVNLVPPGSHLVEVVSPNYLFEKFRVDITRNGKLRARRANFIQPSAVQVVPYPLRFQAIGQAQFFEIRETWKVTDVLFNPMIIMMVLPVLFLVVMPKVLSAADPDMQKEMQSQMSSFNQQSQMPDFSDMLTNWFNKDKKGAGDRAVAKRAGRRK